MKRLTRSFYARYTPEVAKDLIGKVLVRVVYGERLTGEIVETEAYRGAGDPGSHAYRGRTRRNAVMFGEPGTAYIYFIYGFHYCLNVVTEPPGEPAAVLIRAIRPLEGIPAMVKNRGPRPIRELASGPGRLTEALSIGPDLRGEDLVSSPRLFIEEGQGPGLRVARGPRIGLTKGAERRWRFFLAGSEFASRKVKVRENP